MSKDTFVWDDKSVIGFHKYYMGGNSEDIFVSLQEYKQSKMPKKDKDYEVIEIENSFGGKIRKTRDDKSWFEVFNLKSFDGFKINAVKRLSDGEVFENGNETDKGTIVSFRVVSESLCVDIGNEEMMCAWHISNIQKLPPQSKPEQPKKERREVKHFKMYDSFEDGVNNVFWYSFCVYKNIPNDKMPSVKSAIENILNNEEWITASSNISEALREAEEKAFNAGREFTGYAYIGTGWGGKPEELPQLKQKFPTFNDYLNHKSKQ